MRSESWFDLLRSVAFTVVIVGELHTLRAEALDCPSGYTITSGRCYQTSNVPRSWTDAQHDCSSTGGRLAVPDSEAVQRDVSALAEAAVTSSSATSVWIGLEKTRTDWRWTSASGANVFIQPQGCFSSMNNGQFSELAGSDTNYTPQKCRQDCASRGRQYAALVHWKNDVLECRCSDTFTAVSSQLIMCTWKCPSDSNSYCGVDFTEINTVSFSLLVDRLNKVLSTFNGWERGQPNSNLYSNFYPYQSCNALDLSVPTTRFGWNDENCADITYDSSSVQYTYGHICGYDVDNTTCTVQQLISGSQRQLVAGRCISLHPSSSLSWYGARLNCLSQQTSAGGAVVPAGGDLLRVDTEDLRAALTVPASNWSSVLLPPTRWWIDGTNEKWTWSDGRELRGYTNWATRRPSEESNNCAAEARNSSGGWQWTDENCNQQFIYVCQADFLTTTTTTTTTTSSPVPSSSPTHVQPSPPPTNPGPSASQLPPTTYPMVDFDNSTDYNGTALPMPSEEDEDPKHTGVIISIIFTAVVMVITTIRMLTSCCDKTSRDDEVRLTT